MSISRLADTVLDLALQAGRAILRVYDDPGTASPDTKQDGSPVTRADLLAHRVLVEGLERLRPRWPVLSEESGGEVYGPVADWSHFWLVDPLDGTREFTARNGEFTVNVGLVESGPGGPEDGAGRPLLGVVHVPATGVSYLGIVGDGAWRIKDGGERAPLAPRAPMVGSAAKVLTSRSHPEPEIAAFVDRLGEHHGAAEMRPVGSSLKLCLIAEGSAHYYPRLAPTAEWDTAAGQAVVEAAGGVVWRYGTREPMRYGAPERANPGFLAAFGADAFVD